MFGTAIPEAALVRLRDSDGAAWEAVVQRRIDGPTLLDIIGFDGDIVAEFRGRATEIAEQLRIFANAQDVDLSLTNFVFDPEAGRVFYIESKPPLFRTRRRNEFYRRVLRSYIHRYTPTRGV